jgi:hypothetical protein
VRIRSAPGEPEEGGRRGRPARRRACQREGVPEEARARGRACEGLTVSKRHTRARDRSREPHVDVRPSPSTPPEGAISGGTVSRVTRPVTLQRTAQAPGRSPPDREEATKRLRRATASGSNRLRRHDRVPRMTSWRRASRPRAHRTNCWRTRCSTRSPRTTSIRRHLPAQDGVASGSPNDTPRRDTVLTSLTDSSRRPYRSERRAGLPRETRPPPWNLQGPHAGAVNRFHGSERGPARQAGHRRDTQRRRSVRRCG